MEINFQIIVDTVSNLFTIAFPFSLLLCLVAKVTNIFMSFVFGYKEVKL